MYLICKADDHEYFRNSFSARQTAVQGRQQCRADSSSKQAAVQGRQQGMTDSCILETFPDIYKSRTDQRKGQTTAMTDKTSDIHQ